MVDEQYDVDTSKTYRLKDLVIYPDKPPYDKMGYNGATAFELNGEGVICQGLIKSGDIVFDVGANRGKWSQYVLSYVKPSFMYIFEPLPEAFSDLKKIFRSSNIILNNCAVAHTDGNRTFYYYTNDPNLAEMSSFYRRPLVEKKLGLNFVGLQVETRSLDSFCMDNVIDRIDFIKIDTEGAEFDVLSGATQLISDNRVSYIQFEYGGTYSDAGITLQEIFHFFAKFHYSVFRIVPKGLVHINKWKESLENYKYSNYLAVASPFSAHWTIMDHNGNSRKNLRSIVDWLKIIWTYPKG